VSVKNRLLCDAIFPGDNLSREIVEFGGKIEPFPSHGLYAGEVGLPHLINGCVNRRKFSIHPQLWFRVAALYDTHSHLEDTLGRRNVMKTPAPAHQVLQIVSRE
jgi:hypothetical protein